MIQCVQCGSYFSLVYYLSTNQGVAKRNSSFLSALQTSQVLHIWMNAQLTYEAIVL